ncbi:MAG: RagB/SusD family nutrient uptake outer membrane protein [Bacteroidetes bacterium]|nr:RagB/SusD family nutrient uptake outer membrane protein [Bacteroidota bacterium]
MSTKFLQITRIGAAIAVTIAFFASCSKQIDLTPTDSIDPTKAFRTVDDLNQGLLGAYAALSYRSSIYFTSLVTDECMLPSENSSGSGFATHRWQYDGSMEHDAWPGNYVAIDRVNRVLAAMDVVEVKPGEEALKSQYKGELLALRAYCHFELIRNFAEKYEPGAMGVPFMEKSEVGSPARLSFGETMAKIDNDLMAAKGLIPDGAADRTRITKIAVSAMQARVALYEKNWDNAVNYATEAINALPLADRTNFPKIWKDKTEDEVFWKLKRVAGDETLGDVYTQPGYLQNPGVKINYAASYKLTNLFDRANDIRFSSYITIDAGRLASGAVPNVVVKYMSDNASTSNLVDIKLYRTGEMYLIRSEAYAEKNDLISAAADLNALRRARINGYTDATFSDKQSLIDALMNERFKELAFEGHRHFDLRRRNLPISRNPEDAVNALGAVLLNPTDAQYVFPIPNTELKANKNMKQNDGY